MENANVQNVSEPQNTSNQGGEDQNVTHGTRTGNGNTPGSSTQQTGRPRSQNAGRQQRHRGRRGINRNNLRSREGFFMHYLFITVSVRYASYFKPTARRLIEFFALIKAIFMLLLLIYVHATFVKESGNCLEHIESIWPRNGVLKVQVEANTSVAPYQFYFVKQTTDDWVTSFRTSPHQAVFKYSLHLGPDGVPIHTPNEAKTHFRQQTPNDALKRAREVFGLRSGEKCPAFNITSLSKEDARKLFIQRFSEVTPEIEFLHMKEEDYPKWILEDTAISDTVAEKKMLQMQEVSGFSIGPQPVRSYYAIEYSTEFGYLRLSALTRYKLGIPVLVVTLDPFEDECFGEGAKRWMMDTFFGYDDLVMGSIKHLAEKDNKQGGGYLRNLVTGEHYKFITLWVSHASYLLAFAVMLVFTLVVTMLLRYSYHQIFVFMVELLHILDMDATPVFPAAPMLTIILALVGTEEIMTEFFHDSTLAFYVILCIWIADQFDAICMHTIVSRRHWVRFFFLYHFAFYAYHYRFNGQFSELALFTSWLFIQHSMFYFFHHYELPAIQRQMRLRQAILQRRPTTPSAPSSPENPEGSRDNEPPPDSTSGGDAPPAPANEEPSTSGTQGDVAPPAPDNQPRDPVQQNEAGQSICPEEGTAVSLKEDDEKLKDNVRERSLLEAGQRDNLAENVTEYSDTVLETPTVVGISDTHDINDTTSVMWEEELKTVFENDEVTEIETNIGHGSVGVFKYCNIVVFLFFAIISLILVFAFVTILLSQGRVGARFGPRDIDDVAGLVR